MWLCVVIQSEIQAGPRDLLIDLTAMKDSSLGDVRIPLSFSVSFHTST